MAQEALAATQTIDSQTLAQQGHAYLQAGHDEKAIGYFTRALDAAPKYAWALANRAEAYYQMQRYDEALEDFNRSIELKPEYAWALAHRGALYRQLQAYEKALADLTRAIKLKPDYVWALTHRGSVQTILRCYKDALTDLDRIIALDPTRLPSVPGERGMLLNYLGRYAETIAVCRQGLENDPDDYAALYSLSVAEACEHGAGAARNRIDRARTRLLFMDQQPVLNSATRAAVQYRLGGLAALQGQTEQALRYLEGATFLDGEPEEMVRHDPAWLDLRDYSRVQLLNAR